MLFRDAFDGGARCLADECPHRLAPLSEGRLVDADGTTRVECSYHGWQFEGKCGSCALLPQLDEAALAERKYENWGARYGARTHAVAERQGIVFVWLRAGAAPSSEPPVVPNFEEAGWIYEQDYARDLPYDYTTLVENVIDPSHVPVSHHGTSQGDRALARPLPLTVKDRGSGGSVAAALSLAGEVTVPLHGSSRLGFARTTATQTVRFEAPSRLSYEFELPGGKRAIALFYAVPVARGRSRVLVRRGRDFNTEAKMTRAALVAKHLENNVVFDQDLAFLRGQEERLQAYKADGHGGAWRDEYVVPSSADRFVVNYRKKLDGLAATMPWRTAPAPLAPLPRRELLDRYEQHTKGCAVCSSALAETRALAKAARGARNVAAFALLCRAATGGPAAPFSLAVSAAAAAFGAALLRSDVVGPTVAAAPNALAAPPLVFAALHLVAAAAGLPRVAGALATASAAALAATAALAARKFAALEARFIYTEEAKALQHAP